MPSETKDLVREKLTNEIKKLGLEIQELKRPTWRRPAYWLSTATAIVALGGFVFQREEAGTAKREATDAKIASIAAHQSAARASLTQLRAEEAAEVAQRAMERIEKDKIQALEDAGTAKTEKESAERDTLKAQKAQLRAERAAARAMQNAAVAKKEYDDLQPKIQDLKIAAKRAKEVLDAKIPQLPAQEVARASDVSAALAEAERALPNPGLLDCAVLGDGDHFIAVGEGGVIILTEDGGESWRDGFKSKDWDSAQAVCASEDGRYIFVGGQQSLESLRKRKDVDVLIYSDNGGRSWKPCHLSGARVSEILHLACSADGQYVWAVSNMIAGGDFVFRSDDYGAGWKRVSSGSTLGESLAVHVSKNGSSVWLGGVAEAVWEKYPDGSPSTMYSISVIDRTEDGGRSWRRSVIPEAVRGEDWDESQDIVGTADDSVLWAFREHPNYDGEPFVRFFGSVDRGMRWIVVSRQPFEGMKELFATPDGSRLYAMTFGEVFMSLDQGRNWQEVETTVPELGWFESLAGTLDGQVLWVVGDKGLIEKSTDSGKTWETILYPG